MDRGQDSIIGLPKIPEWDETLENDNSRWVLPYRRATFVRSPRSRGLSWCLGAFLGPSQTRPAFHYLCSACSASRPYNFAPLQTTFVRPKPLQGSFIKFILFHGIWEGVCGHVWLFALSSVTISHCSGVPSVCWLVLESSITKHVRSL